jgi:hypothetical protein
MAGLGVASWDQHGNINATFDSALHGMIAGRHINAVESSNLEAISSVQGFTQGSQW